jgi:putative ABC transport system permease protein
MRDDLRFGLRTLARNPGFTILALLTLSLGIAANTAIFSLVYGVLLRPLPYRDADRIVSVWTASPSDSKSSHSAGDFIDLQRENTSFTAIAGWREDIFAVVAGDSGAALPVEGAHVTVDFFDVLGVPALRGRGFSRAVDGSPGEPSVVIAEPLWRDAFHADDATIGQRVRVNGVLHTIVGVMPDRVRWPAGAQLWRLSPRPVPPSPVDFPDTDRDVRYFDAIARLRDEASNASVRGDLARVAAVLDQRRSSGAEQRTIEFAPLRDQIVGGVRIGMLVLQAGVGLVLLIACANISSLLIARTVGRHRELAVRAALGARGWRLLRQLLTESLLIGAIGGTLGLLLGHWGLRMLRGVLPAAIPRPEAIALDATVAAATIVIAMIAGVVFGALPAIHASRTNAASALHSAGGRGATGGRGRTRSALVVGEVALTLVLLVAAGLLTNSLLRLQRVDSGFEAGGVTLASLALPQTRYPDGPAQARFYTRLLEQLGERAEFQAAGIGFPGPLKGENASGAFHIEGQMWRRGEDRPFAYIGSVSNGYLDALGVSILSGRAFAASDHAKAPGVAIVSVALAKKYWPGDDALGKHLKFDDNPAEPWLTVVGVASDARQIGLAEEPPPIMYIPYQQFSLPFTNVAVRSTLPPETVTAALSAVMSAVDPELPIGEVESLEHVLSGAIAEPRFRTYLFSAFGIVALILAAVGVYGVISFSVAQQTREIGVRVALGAAPRQVVFPIVLRGLGLALTGVAVGLLGAYFASRAIASFLYGVDATDPATFAAVAGVLLLVAMLASYVPARRALRIDPMMALRSE